MDQGARTNTAHLIRGIRASAAAWACLVVTTTFGVEPVAWPLAGRVEPERLKSFGLRVVESQHCVMVTDLPVSHEVDHLPTLVDRALPHWCKRFGIATKQGKDWQIRCCLIGQPKPFQAAGLMPIGRQFADGLALGHEVWMHKQPSTYYTRCLLLHEATHSFMMTQLGDCGPPWYMEGMAELLGTHSFESESGQLQLGIIPPNKQESPMWGRVKLIREAYTRGSVPSLEAIQKIDNRVALDVQSYAWAWALSVFCDQHPRYRTDWQALSEQVLEDDFNTRFFRTVVKDREHFLKEWHHFLSTIDYGYDIPREAITFRPGEPLQEDRTIEILADRGWQSSEIQVEAGKRYQVSATGRFVIGQEADGRPWPCEANGVTLQYHRGQPIGMLLASVDSDSYAFMSSTPVGSGAELTPDRSGTLYFRLNDAPNRLAENQGRVQVTVRVD